MKTNKAAGSIPPWLTGPLFEAVAFSDMLAVALFSRIITRASFAFIVCFSFLFSIPSAWVFLSKAGSIPYYLWTTRHKKEKQYEGKAIGNEEGGVKRVEQRRELRK